MRVLRQFVICVVAVSAVASGGSCAGAIIEFTFTGVVEEIPFGTPSGDWADVTIGTPWTLVYQFDTETPDDNNSPLSGNYLGVGPLTLEAGGGVLAYDEIDIRTNLIGQDDYYVEATGQPEGSLALELYPIGSLPNDALPLSFDLDDFATLLTVSISNDEPFLFRSLSMSFSQRIVPAPAGLPLLFVFLWRRSRFRDQSSLRIAATP